MAVVEYTKESKIAIITLNRPERLNALTSEAVDRIFDAFARFTADDDACTKLHRPCDFH